MAPRVLTLALLLAACVHSTCDAESAIHFDLPATAAAVDITPADSSSPERLVSIEFNLSLIVDSLPVPPL